MRPCLLFDPGVGRIPFIPLCLAGSPHWDGNSERILGGTEHDMDSKESSVELAKGKQGAPLAKTPLSPRLYSMLTVWEPRGGARYSFSIIM